MGVREGWEKSELCDARIFSGLDYVSPQEEGKYKATSLGYLFLCCGNSFSQQPITYWSTLGVVTCAIYTDVKVCAAPWLLDSVSVPCSRRGLLICESTPKQRNLYCTPFWASLQHPFLAQQARPGSLLSLSLFWTAAVLTGHRCSLTPDLPVLPTWSPLALSHAHRHYAVTCAVPGVQVATAGNLESTKENSKKIIPQKSDYNPTKHTKASNG